MKIARAGLSAAVLLLFRGSASSVEPSWVAAAEARILESEYEPSWKPSWGALQAPTRALGIRTIFEAAGVRVVPRRSASSAAEWEWRLRYRGVRFEGVEISGTADPVEPCADGNRVVYSRAPGVT